MLIMNISTYLYVIKPTSMTPNQKQKLELKIKRIKAALAAEKRKFGWYDDSRGLRYVPLGLYLKLQDYKRGLAYTRWFSKAFPDDAGFPEFLFEWAVVLYMNGKFRETERKAMECYFRNVYLFDKFFGRPIQPIVEMASYSNVSEPGYLDDFPYSSSDEWLKPFGRWLKEFEGSEKFKSIAKRYSDARIRLKTEEDPKMRHYLVRVDRQLL